MERALRKQSPEQCQHTETASQFSSKRRNRRRNFDQSATSEPGIPPPQLAVGVLQACAAARALAEKLPFEERYKFMAEAYDTYSEMQGTLLSGPNGHVQKMATCSWLQTAKTAFTKCHEKSTTRW